MEITGQIINVLPTVSGKKKDGDTWIKQIFAVQTDEQYDNLYAFELFGQDRVSEFNNAFEKGNIVTVTFNIKTNFNQDRYFVSLSAWKVIKA